MSEECKGEESKGIDRFELVTALLLGLTAIGTAVASQQAGQWGGKQLDAFSESNTLTTKAATQYNEDIVQVNADYAAVVQAKLHILEARDAKQPATRERHLDIASYFYTTQLSEAAYRAMGLPMELFVEDEDDQPAAGNQGKPKEAGAAAGTGQAEPKPAKPTKGEQEEPGEEVAAEDALERDIPDEKLIASLPVELDDDYLEKMVAEGEKMFQQADARFAEGRTANNNGDQFDLAVVFFTVALFFAGLGLVFKTRVRWGFFSVGLVIFLVTTVFMVRLPWAG